MAKETCKKCGKEVGFASQVKLMDGAFLCKDCYKKAGKVFHNMAHGYGAYDLLLRQQERDEQIFKQVLKGQKRSKMFGVTSSWMLECYAGSGLMFFKTERGGFIGLGAEKIYNMYRYADLADYQLVNGASAIDHRMQDGKQYILLSFVGDYAVRDVYMEGDEKEYKELAKYFNDCFGLSIGGIGGLKGFMKRNKQEAAAVASIAQGIKGVMAGEKENAVDNIAAGAQILLQGDRSNWIEKTQQALAGAGIEWNV